MSVSPVISFDAGMAQLLEAVQNDLRAVEELIQQEISSSVSAIWSVGEHVLSSGGKRLRPALVCLSAYATGRAVARERLIPLAACAELMHMATLIHDDVVDNATLRRGRPTANVVFGNGVTVLTGDYFLAKAMSLLVQNADTSILRTVVQTAIEMSEGEVLQMVHAHDATVTEEVYFDIIRKKTAVFIESCCRIGAFAVQAPDAVTHALSQYGYHLGMAFQIADDLLDYIGNPSKMGKPTGSDLREGKFTLPLIMALRQAAPADRKKLFKLLEKPMKDGKAQEVIELVRRYDVFRHTKELAQHHASQAAQALRVLPPSKARESLQLLCEYVAQREA